MLLAITQTHSSGRSIAQKLARRLDVPCREVASLVELPVRSPCILLEEPDRCVPSKTEGLVRVLLYGGDVPLVCADSRGCDLAVDCAALGEEGTVELLSQFVALKVMSHRSRTAPAGGCSL